jgi:hypothetical protein
MSSNLLPFSANLGFLGEKRESQGVRFGEHGGCGVIDVPFLSRNSGTDTAERAAALS